MFEAKADVNKMKAELAVKNQDLAQAAKESEELLKQISASTAIAEKEKQKVAVIVDAVSGWMERRVGGWGGEGVQDPCTCTLLHAGPFAPLPIISASPPAPCLTPSAPSPMCAPHPAAVPPYR